MCVLTRTLFHSSFKSLIQNREEEKSVSLAGQSTFRLVWYHLELLLPIKFSSFKVK